MLPPTLHFITVGWTLAILHASARLRPTINPLPLPPPPHRNNKRNLRRAGYSYGGEGEGGGEADKMR
jgi:hypothetical protein